MRVKEIMKRTVKTITPDRPVTEAAEIMMRFAVDHVVVVEHGTPVGILSDGDIARRNGDGLVQSAMTRAVVTIDADELISRAANVMRGHSIKCLVVTRGKKLAGILTTSELLEVVGRSGHRERMIMRDRGPKRRPDRI